MESFSKGASSRFHLHRWMVSFEAPPQACFVSRRSCFLVVMLQLVGGGWGLRLQPSILRFLQCLLFWSLRRGRGAAVRHHQC